ncbi:MAG TPA: hypothetical protein VHG30_06090 [Microvirga sp.]|nr:hypothetical protein [Microvirga sp.]
MTFVLRSVCRECYVLEYRGGSVGIAFRHEDGAEPWVAMLYDRKFPYPADFPSPFVAREHSFHTLRELRAWLSGSMATASAVAGRDAHQETHMHEALGEASVLPQAMRSAHHD